MRGRRINCSARNSPESDARVKCKGGVMKPGDKAPAFKLPSSTGQTINLADFKGKRIVLYFYPRADTPGCTTEACGFRDAIAGYRKLNVPVFGISPDPIKDVQKFSDKFKL